MEFGPHGNKNKSSLSIGLRVWIYMSKVSLL